MSFNEQFSVAVKHTLMQLQHNYVTGYFLITVIKIIAEHTDNGLMSQWIFHSPAGISQWVVFFYKTKQVLFGVCCFVLSDFFFNRNVCLSVVYQ